jgi:hypothetical protein
MLLDSYLLFGRCVLRTGDTYNSHSFRSWRGHFVEVLRKMLSNSARDTCRNVGVNGCARAYVWDRCHQIKSPVSAERAFLFTNTRIERLMEERHASVLLGFLAYVTGAPLAILHSTVHSNSEHTATSHPGAASGPRDTYSKVETATGVSSYRD